MLNNVKQKKKQKKSKPRRGLEPGTSYLLTNILNHSAIHVTPLTLVICAYIYVQNTCFPLHIQKLLYLSIMGISTSVVHLFWVIYSSSKKEIWYYAKITSIFNFF
jgi:hypothetical protein